MWEQEYSYRSADGVAVNLHIRTLSLITWWSKFLEELSWPPEETVALEKQLPLRQPSETIFLHIVDLFDPKKIWKFVENFKQKHKLNVLINNTGCMVKRELPEENGHEKNFATNTLGKYMQFSSGLIPVLEKEYDPRVVISGGRLVQKLNTSDRQKRMPLVDLWSMHKTKLRWFSQDCISLVCHVDSFPGKVYSGMGIHGDLRSLQQHCSLAGGGGSPSAAEHSSAGTGVGLQSAPTSSLPAEEKLIEILEELTQTFKQARPDPRWSRNCLRKCEKAQGRNKVSFTPPPKMLLI
ncbi:LOW QUALITY PROTEIN: dehydrogenase/reductase SDR family member 12 [Rhynchonycteris naso]